MLKSNDPMFGSVLGFSEILISAICYSFDMVRDFMASVMCKIETDTLLRIQCETCHDNNDKLNYRHDISFTHV